MLLLTASTVHFADALYSAAKQSTRSSSLRCSNSRSLNFEHKFNLRLYRSTLNKRQYVAKKPAQCPSPNNPLIRATCFRGWCFAEAQTPTPTNHEEINYISIGTSETHTSLRHVACSSATDRNGPFTIEAASSPTQLSNQWFLERPSGLVSQPLVQSLRRFLSVSFGSTLSSAQSTISSPIRLDVEVRRDSAMPVSTFCLVSGCQTHTNLRVT